MSGELHPNSEAVINLHVIIRDKICEELCPGGRYCRNMACLQSFFMIAGQVEMKLEEQHEHIDKRP